MFLTWAEDSVEEPTDQSKPKFDKPVPIDKLTPASTLTPSLQPPDIHLTKYSYLFTSSITSILEIQEINSHYTTKKSDTNNPLNEQLSGFISCN